ncbi:MAG: aconitase X [Promethearchaeota archaeon]
MKSLWMISIGCPHLSREEVLIVLEKLKGKKIAPGINFWICTNKKIKLKAKSSR